MCIRVSSFASFAFVCTFSVRLLFQAKVQATWLVLGTSFMVAFTNAAINKITKMMGVFERHLSVDQQEVQQTTRIVFCRT